MNRVRLAAALAAAAALAPASAIAATDHNTTLDATKTAFEWDSKLGTGFVADASLKPKVPCGTAAVHDCDTTLIKVDGGDFGATLSVATTSTEKQAIDTDLYLYESDANGTIGNQVASSAQATPTPNESLSTSTAPGVSYYVAEIDYAINPAGTVHGKATWEALPPPDPEDDGGE